MAGVQNSYLMVAWDSNSVVWNSYLMVARDSNLMVCNSNPVVACDNFPIGEDMATPDFVKDHIQGLDIWGDTVIFPG